MKQAYQQADKTLLLFVSTHQLCNPLHNCYRFPDKLQFGAKQVAGVALHNRATSLPITSTTLPLVEVPSLGSPVYGSFFLHHRTLVEADVGDWDAAASSKPDQAQRYSKWHFLEQQQRYHGS
jgi:hypothetical protein